MASEWNGCCIKLSVPHVQIHHTCVPQVQIHHACLMVTFHHNFLIIITSSERLFLVDDYQYHWEYYFSN